MLTHYLERLIHEGKASYREQAIGGSGVSTIPVSTHEKVIITDFTWFPFCEVSTVFSVAFVDYAPIVRLDFSNIGGNPTISVGNILTLQTVLSVPIGTGQVVSVTGGLFVAITAGDVSTIGKFLNVTTGGVFNAGIIAFQAFAPVEGLLDTTTLATATINSDTPTATAGKSPGTLKLGGPVGVISNGNFITGTTSGANALLTTGLYNTTVNVSGTLTNAIASSIHHVRFKSKGVVAVFNFRDLISGVLTVGGDTPTIAGWILPDPTVVNTYIVCEETVQIDIWKFSPSGNTFNNATVFGGMPAKSKEPEEPNGYTGAAVNPAILQIVTAQGATIWELSDARQDITGAARNKDQFVDDIGALTELNQPTNNESFPLVNVGYVL